MSQTMYPAIPNSPITELVSNITDTQTTIQVVDISSFPDAPNIATIGIDTDNPETILYEGKSGSSLTGATRGFQGIAQNWDAGIKIARLFTEYDYDALRGNLDEHLAESVAHGTTGDIVGTTDAQTLTNKTLTDVKSVLINHKSAVTVTNSGAYQVVASFNGAFNGFLHISAFASANAQIANYHTYHVIFRIGLIRKLTLIDSSYGSSSGLTGFAVRLVQNGSNVDVEVAHTQDGYVASVSVGRSGLSAVN